jgi:hypothetical protein
VKKLSFFLIIFLLSYSCNGLRQERLSQYLPTDYCGLLHVPTEWASVPEPKAYLGIYLSPKRLDTSIVQCTHDVFIEVAGVINGSPAMRAGLKKHDVILQLDGVPLCGDSEDILSSLKRTISQRKIGSVVRIDVLREDEVISLTTVLDAPPSVQRAEAAHAYPVKCDSGSSLLLRTLENRNDLSLFQDIISGLYERSNIIHNPGLFSGKKSDPFQLGEVTYMMRHPLSAGEAAKAISDRLLSSFRSGDRPVRNIVREAAALVDRRLEIPDMKEDLTFPSLMRILAEAGEAAERSLSMLDPAERRLLREKALEPTADVAEWKRILELSARFNEVELFNSFAPLLSALSPENLSILRQDLLKRFQKETGPVLFETMTSAGKIIIGGTGPNLYREDAALILDLGGDDLYLNNAGGTRDGLPVALVIDWEGNDRYISRENFSQGAGLLGGGFLLDLSGDDTFVTLDGGQGAGFWGIGVLYHGDGDTRLESRSLSQGVGQAGIGAILNRKGRSIYRCAFQGQALGLFAGSGLIIDEAGRDSYQLGGLEPDFRDPSRSTVSMGQGFGEGMRADGELPGVPGGIGILIDGEGDDSYSADYFAQGGAYYYGLGILHDLAGNDEYIAGRYAQGAGIHSAVGILLDKKGDDFYYASFGVAQGMGHDFGVGFLEDDEGDDSYRGGMLIQAAATTGGLGIFMDGGGINNLTHDKKGGAYAEGDDGMGILIKPDPADKYKLRIKLGTAK